LEIRQLRRTEGRVRLRFTVSDTGIGMSEAFLNSIFDPFEQESAVIGQKYGGTGLGMPITKNLVTLMGGTIS
ncbi:ATP-binding protein, partial [Eubacterium callanderi]